MVFDGVLYDRRWTDGLLESLLSPVSIKLWTGVISTASLESEVVEIAGKAV